MAKVDADTVKKVHSRLLNAKVEHFKAHMALEALPEFTAAKKADCELEMAEDCLAGIQMLLNAKVV